VAAPPQRVDSNGVALLPAVSSATKFRNPSRIFMPECKLRWRAAAPVLEDVKIRMAGPSSADPNQDLSWTGYGGRYLGDLRRAASANKSYRFHRISMRVNVFATCSIPFSGRIP
jgi:hypothetical protein